MDQAAAERELHALTVLGIMRDLPAPESALEPSRCTVLEKSGQNGIN